MSARLTGKTAVVTGGASGIGRATAELMAAEGAAVGILDLDLSAGEAVVEAIAAAGGRAFAARGDVTDAQSLAAAFDAVERQFGSISIVASNAGLARYPRPVDEALEADFDAIFAVNVKGAWNTVRAAIPSLRRAGGGSIVITGSIMGERARPGQSIYAASKAAANHLARSFALDLAGDAIRVNALAPVATDTPMLPMFLGPERPEEARVAFINGIPLGRLAAAADIAGAAVFLASDEAAFITGVVLPVDGGRGV